MTGAPTTEAAAPPFERMPDGWGAGMWRLTGHSAVAGWLLIPAEVADADDWVRTQRDELRSAWGATWQDDWDLPVTELLAAGLDARPDEAALAFQIWPVPAPLLVQVSASFGARPDVLPGALADGARYEARGLGTGIQLVRRFDAPEGGVPLVGLDVVFVADETIVIVRFEPTVPELHAMLVGQFHAFVHTLEFTGPDGAPIRGTIPDGLLPEEDWSESVSA